MYKDRKGQKILVEILKYTVLVTACLLVILPLIVVLLGSFKSHKDYLTSGIFSLPSEWRFENYKTAFIRGNVLLGLKNTGIILFFTCAGSLLLGSMAAFVIQRFDNLMSRIVKTAFLLAMLMPGIAMQVTVFKIVDRIGLYDSILAPIVLGIGTDVISLYLFIQYLSQISVSIDESAIVDGASYPRVYFSIILPLMTPAMITVLLMKFISVYNDFYTANLYMPSERLGVVSTALYRFMGPYGSKWEIIFAGIIICVIPTLVVFLSLQKYIYDGLVRGAIKE